MARMGIGFVVVVVLAVAGIIGTALFQVIGWWLVAVPFIPGALYLVGTAAEKIGDALDSWESRP